MRFRVRRQWTCRFDPPAKSLIGQLRVTPRDGDGQMVGDWVVELSADCALRAWEDAYGNIAHSFEAQGDIDALVVTATGVVDLEDSAGFVRVAQEPFPAELFLRESPLALADAAIRAFAAAAVANADGPLGRMHALMDATHEAMTFQPESPARADAAQALAAAAGCGRDLAHVFVAAARHLGAPARYVEGLSADVPGAAHGWAEAWVEGYGWIAFDPALNVCPAGRHLRIAAALDAQGAEPLRVLRQSLSIFGADALEGEAAMQAADPRAGGQ